MSPGFCLCKTGNTNDQHPAGSWKDWWSFSPRWALGTELSLPVTFAPSARSPAEQVVTLESWLLGSTTGTLASDSASA